MAKNPLAVADALAQKCYGRVRPSWTPAEFGGGTWGLAALSALTTDPPMVFATIIPCHREKAIRPKPFKQWQIYLETWAIGAGEFDLVSSGDPAPMATFVGINNDGNAWTCTYSTSGTGLLKITSPTAGSQFWTGKKIYGPILFDLAGGAPLYEKIRVNFVEVFRTEDYP